MVPPIMLDEEVGIERGTQKILGEELVPLVGPMTQFVANVDTEGAAADPRREQSPPESSSCGLGSKHPSEVGTNDDGLHRD